MDMRQIEPQVSDQMSVGTGRHAVARANVYPLRRLARVFRFVSVASLAYALVIVGIAIEAAIIKL
jgi:hypothetical protein